MIGGLSEMKRYKPARVYTGDKALEKILNAAPNELQDIQKERIKKHEIAIEELNTIKRHLKGGLMAIERALSPFQPKCSQCYDKYGFLTKCVCNVGSESV